MDNPIMLFILFGLIPTCVFAFLYFQSREKQSTENDVILEDEATDADNQNDTPTAVKPTEHKVKGRVWGTLGMLYMGGYALYIRSVLDGANVTNLGEAIGKAAALNIFQPFFYAVLAAAILSFVGVVSKNKTCILLALAATIGSVFIVTGAFEMLLIPAVFFLISYLRMAK